jgi:hypothetical protein
LFGALDSPLWSSPLKRIELKSLVHRKIRRF